MRLSANVAGVDEMPGAEEQQQDLPGWALASMLMSDDELFRADKWESS